MDYYAAEAERLNASFAETFFPNASVTDRSSNATASLEKILKIKPVTDNVLLVALILIMLCMGVEVKKDQLLHHIKKPIGICIGMFSQFIALPLLAFSLLQCVTVSEIRATGVLLLSCCPGGVFSNIFAYYCDGDLSLSVSMTSMSTLLAMGMMPLNLWMYGRVYETDRIVIPYTKIFISLMSVTSPVAVGMLLRWKLPRIASALRKVGSIVSLLLVVIYPIVETIVFPNMFDSIPESLYGIVIGLPCIGFSLAYMMASLFRQNSQVRKTIAIECGIQNVPMALGMITLSVPAEMQGEVIPLPYLYWVGSLSCGTLLCIIYRLYRRCSHHGTAYEDDNMKQICDGTGTLKCEEETTEEDLMMTLSGQETTPGYEIPQNNILVPLKERTIWNLRF